MSTVTVTPTVEPSTGPSDPPRVRLDVTDTGTPAVTSTTVVRLGPDGRTVPVRTDDGGPLALSGAAGLLYDYEAPFGVAVTYSTQESPTVVSAAVTVNEPDVWLIHPGVPEISTPIELRIGSLDEEEWAAPQAVHWPIGRERPIVHTDGARKAPSSSLTVAVESADDLARLRNVLFDSSTLLLNIPAGLGLGVDTDYIAVGSVTNARPSSIGSDPLRAVRLPFQVVDRPVGGSQAERTWADVVVDNATWADVTARYSTWLDLLAGP